MRVCRAEVFATRPSGTGDLYKLYAENFHGKEHLKRIQEGSTGIDCQSADLG